KAGAARDNAAVSSADTKEPSPGGQAGGQSPGSAARARSVLAFPWAVPGRSEEPGPALRAPSAGPAPAAAAPRQGALQSLREAAPRDGELPGTAQGQHEASSKPREVTLLDRIFRLDKGPERIQPEGDPQQPDLPNGSIAAAPHRKANECSQKDLGQDSAGVQGEQDSPQAAAGHGSVMSFLKTLYSPPPAVVHKGSRADKGHGGQPAPKAAAESPSKGAKKKKAESPKLGHGTFSKLFRHKAAKETQQTTNTKSPEQPPIPSVKSDRNLPASQEPPAKQNPKAPEVVAPPQGVTTEIPREATKDKGSATPLPLSKLFWKKNSSEEAEAVSNEKAEAAPEAAAPDRDESRSVETAELKPRGPESKTPKANLRKFFKLTLNATEKPLAPSDSDPGGQRSKEGSKDRKFTLELGKKGGKESREQPEPREPPATDPDSVHNGGDPAKEPPCKKAEKRQSLGGFFKGLGSKRTSDAEVQTDPVSIVPAGKSK
ncbi:BCAS1 protein, partial [Malurus elegans]|nr:BCAS1 protein [Malurus elegans]